MNSMLRMSVALCALFAFPAHAETQVKIGILNDLSGQYADIGGHGSVIAAQMAVEDFEAEKKGIKVEILSADHQNKPEVASNITRQWFDIDGVDVIMDLPTSSTALAVNEITREKNRIFIASGSATSELTGAKCSPNTIQWTYDTWSLANSTARAVVREGGKSWYFITADFAFGHALEKDAKAAIESEGGTVIGGTRHPFPSGDMASFLLQAQSSGADVIGLATAGGDLGTAIKQGTEFGIPAGGQVFAGLTVFITDVHAIGLQNAQGVLLTESFYWNLNEQTRGWSVRFAERNKGTMPTMVHAGIYSGLLHYLKAVEALGAKDAAKVMAQMKATPTKDPLFGEGSVRADGRKIHDMYLFRVKEPSQQKAPWDYYDLVATIPGSEAFRPLSEGNCPLVAQ